MNNQVVPFDFDQKQIRVVMREGEPWFVGNDVAEVLGYKDPSRSVKGICKKAQVAFKSELTGEILLLEPIPNRGLRIIPESDLYRMVMRSNTRQAEKFQDWVTSEVLPSIRKHGGYIAGQSQLSEEELQQRAQQLAKSIIAERDRLIAERDLHIICLDNKLNDATNKLRTATYALERAKGEASSARKQLVSAAPKLAIGQQFMESKTNTSLRDVAKMLGFKETDFRKVLHDMRWIYRATFTPKLVKGFPLFPHAFT